MSIGAELRQAMTRMSVDAFERLIGETECAGVAVEAARLVCCEGMTQKAAAAAFGIDQAAVSRIVSRVERLRLSADQACVDRLLWISGALRDGLLFELPARERAQLEAVLERGLSALGFS